MTIKTITFATFALIGAVAAEHQQVFMDCLMQTDAHGKDALDEPNMQPYRRSNFTGAGITSNMRITKIKTCIGDGTTTKLKGFGFTLSDPNDPSGPEIELPFMGKANGACDTVDVPAEGITGIRTYQNYWDEMIYGIAWYSANGWEKVYNELELEWYQSDSDIKNWTFDDPNTPVMGMYGKVNQDDKIKQLGWIKLDTQC